MAGQTSRDESRIKSPAGWRLGMSSEFIVSNRYSDSKVIKWRKIVTGIAEELKVVQTVVALQPALREAAQNGMHAQTTKMTELKSKWRLREPCYHSCQQNMMIRPAS